MSTPSSQQSQVYSANCEPWRRRGLMSTRRCWRTAQIPRRAVAAPMGAHRIGLHSVVWCASVSLVFLLLGTVPARAQSACPYVLGNTPVEPGAADAGTCLIDDTYGQNDLIVQNGVALLFAEGRTRGAAPMRILAIRAGTAIAVAAISLVASPQDRPGLSSEKLQQEPRPGAQQDPPRAVILSGKSSVELRIVTATYNRKVLSVPSAQGIRTLTWSPNHSLLAFETFDREGHSPLTSTHVWVVKADGTGRTQVLLPPPNSYFSTHIGSWDSPDALRLISEVPNESVFLNWMYVYTTNTVHLEYTP